MINAKPAGGVNRSKLIQGIWNYNTARDSKHAAGSVVNIAIDATGMQTGTANKDAEYGILGVLSTAKLFSKPVRRLMSACLAMRWMPRDRMAL